MNRRREPLIEALQRDNLNTLVRKLLVIAVVLGSPTIVAAIVLVGPKDPVVRWGYPPLLAYLALYVWVLLKRPNRVIAFSRTTLVLFDLAWMAGTIVRLRIAADATTGFYSLFPTIFMGLVIFEVVGFLFFSPRGALVHSGALAGGVVVAGVIGWAEQRDPNAHLVELMRYAVFLVVVGLLLQVLSRAKARLTLAVTAAQHASAEALVMRDMAYRDALTGVANRRRLIEELTFQAQRVDADYPVGIVYFDLDLFKQINDVHGHAVGDEVLRAVAAVAGRLVRQVDLVARLGGEEFVIVAPGTGVGRAEQLAERLRRTLPEEVEQAAGAPVTASFGVVALHRGESADAVLTRVDALMYEAKTTGRDRVVASVA
ncbi:MAG TPA: GGDEF domain-containing protein [Actinotalea sp.]